MDNKDYAIRSVFNKIQLLGVVTNMRNELTRHHKHDTTEELQELLLVHFGSSLLLISSRTTESHSLQHVC